MLLQQFSVWISAGITLKQLADNSRRQVELSLGDPEVAFKLQLQNCFCALEVELQRAKKFCNKKCERALNPFS